VCVADRTRTVKKPRNPEYHARPAGAPLSSERIQFLTFARV
jgi:hypothetical protein